MPVWGCLAKLSPLDPATGSRVDVYVSSFGQEADSIVNGLGGIIWEPCMTRAPAIGIALWSGDFGVFGTPAQAAFAANLAQLQKSYDVAALAWGGAPVTIYAGHRALSWPWTAAFTGRVTAYGGNYPAATFTCEVDTEPFSANILTATYAGTGGIEGGADVKNKVKPLCIGWVQNAEPVLIDAVNSIYQFSAYGAIEAVTYLYERGSDFGATFGDYANYTALAAATVPAGRWATSLAYGLVKLGAPQAGVITGDIKGHKVGSTTPIYTGATISALATIAGVSSGLLETSTFTALDTAAPYTIGMFITDQSTFIERAVPMALACNWQAGISPVGKFFVSSLDPAATPTLTLHVQGEALPLVTSSDEQTVSPPYWKTTLGAARSWRVHSADEIASAAPLIDRGRYDPAVTYREGNMVDLADGSRWEYVNPVASAGNSPPSWPTTSNTYWANMTPPDAGAVSGGLTRDSESIAASSSGTVASYSGVGGQMIVSVGGVPITTGVTYSVVSATSGTTASIDSAGNYTISAMTTDSGSAALRAVYGSYTFDKTFSLSKSKAGVAGSTGSPGITPLSASAAPNPIAVPCTPGGTPKAALPGFDVTVFQGTTDVSASASYTVTSAGLSGVANTGPAFTVAGMSADTGSVAIDISYGGASTTLQVTYTKTKDGPAYVQGTSAISAPSTTSYAQVAIVSRMMGPNGTLDVDANGAYTKVGAGGTLGTDGYLEYSLTGGSSWAALGTGTYMDNPVVSGSPGDFSILTSVSGSSIGLSAAQIVDVRLMMKKTNTNSFATFGGDLNIQWAG